MPLLIDDYWLYADGEEILIDGDVPDFSPTPAPAEQGRAGSAAVVESGNTAGTLDSNAAATIEPTNLEAVI